VAGQPYKCISTYLTDVDKHYDYARYRDINVLKKQKFFSSLGIVKMKSLLPPNRSIRKGTDDTRIQDLDPEYSSSDEHESDP
jgi:hypothetical protein